MSNCCWNFKLPVYCEKYGTDWTNFLSIVEENGYDHTIKKIWELYWLVQIDKMSEKIVQIYIDLLKIPYASTDDLKTKKLRLRTFVSKQADKALEDIYLDIGEGIVGIRGNLYLEDNLVWRWDSGRWYGGTDRLQQFLRWPSSNPKFVVYFDCKTLDSTELDQIQELLRDDNILPAFYKMYLVDDNFNILRTI